MEDFHAIDTEEVNSCEDDPNNSSLRVSCFVHTLQLCVRDGLCNAPYVSKLLEKCHSVAKSAHKSSKIAELTESLEKSIHTANVTRWNSEYLLIKSIVAVGKSGLEAIARLMKKPVNFSKNDLIILDEIVQILEPFHEISVRCQAETAVTVSLVVPSITHLLGHLADMQRNVSFLIKLVRQLTAAIEKRFSGIVDRINQRAVADGSPFSDALYFIAAVLDPHFKFY